MKIPPVVAFLLTRTLLLCSSVRVPVAAANNNATLTLLSGIPTSKCLDGSSSGFYYKPATRSGGKTKWIFMLEGGGLCSHQQDCQGRAKTDLGSSNAWAQTFDFDTISITSSDPSNPFAGWNYVYMPYCDGGMWSGQRTSASNETFGLYFSGHNNVAATIGHLSEKNGLNTTGNFVIFSGGSAGGVGVFANYEYVAEQLSTGGVTVVGAPVGGFPPALQWYTGKNSDIPEEDVRNSNFPYLYHLFDAYTSENCRKAYTSKADYYKCFIPYMAYSHFKTPVFIIEAITDVVIMGGFEGMAHTEKALFNPDVWKWIKEYGVNATENFKQINATRDGLFAPSCLLHTQFYLDKPIIDNTNVATALYGWAEQYMPSSRAVQAKAGKHMYMDVCKSGTYYPPCNKKCPKIF